MKKNSVTISIVLCCVLLSFIFVSCKQQSAPETAVTAVEMNEQMSWTIKYSDGTSKTLGKLVVEDGETKPLDVSADGKWIVEGKTTNVQLSSVKRLVTPSFDEEIDVEPLSVLGGRYKSDGKVVHEENSNYNTQKFAVVAGERYSADFAVQANTTFGVVFGDDDDNVVYRTFRKNNVYTVFKDVQLTVPQGATYMYVTSRNPMEVNVKKIQSVRYYCLADVSAVLKIAAFNCGQFSYNTENATTEQFAANWKQMISDVNADIFSFEDIVKTNVADGKIDRANSFTVGVSADSVIGSAQDSKLYYADGAAQCLTIASKIVPTSTYVIPLAYTTEGATKETQRFYAFRTTYLVGGKTIAVYSVHLCADGHMGNESTESVQKLGAALRAQQFAELIEDAKLFDGAVIAGDFNARTAAEYEIFSKAGYSMVNDGTIATLRGTIPADNIVVCGDVVLQGSSLIKDYTLNTDHYGFVATVLVK